jgi:cobalamin-dependent methionine synthase I
MLIIGEKINTVRKKILNAFVERDENCIRSEAISQVEAGADIIDINAGSNIDIEPENMAWAVRIVQEAVDVPLCLDSPNPKTIRAGFDACNNKKNAWANSIIYERESIDRILPLVKEYNCPVIALCMSGKNIPHTSDGRIEIAKKLVDVVSTYDIPLTNLYLDPMIDSVSIGTNKGLVCLQTLRKIKRTFPDVKTVICLSAISSGLPQRNLINRVYLPFLVYECIDAVFLDPLDKKLMTHLKTANMLLDRDPYCMDFITAHRKGSLED